MVYAGKKIERHGRIGEVFKMRRIGYKTVKNAIEDAIKNNTLEELTKEIILAEHGYANDE
jgi:hypothetical protein